MTFFLTCLFMILVFWRPQEWLATWLYGGQILDIICFLAIVAFIAESQYGLARFRADISQIWLLAGLYVAALISHVIPHFYWAGLMWTIEPVFKICFFTVLLLCVLDRPDRLRAVAAIFVVMACVMTVHALLQQSRGYGFRGQPPVFHQRPGRPAPTPRSIFFGIFEDPNDLAQILVTSMPFAFVITKRRTIWSLILGCGIVYLLMRGFLTTDSRGGMIGLAAAAAVGAGLFLPTRWLGPLLLIIAIVALTICPFVGPFMDRSAHDRVVYWGQANGAFKRYPLFGVGFGMFGEYVDKSAAAHNAFVYTYTSLGLFGYWFWYNLLQLGILGAWRARIALSRLGGGTEERWLKRFAGAAITAMAGFTASAYFLTRAFVYPLFYLFALLGAIVQVAAKYLPEEAEPLVKPRRDVLVYGTVGAFASITYIYVSIVLLNKAYYG